MVDAKIESLMQAQVKRDLNLVRDWARGGSNYAFTPHARSLMDRFSVDKIEIAECLECSVLREHLPMLGFIRYRVEPEESHGSDIRIASVTVCLHAEIMTIEVISFKMKEVIQ